jgi:uncharacterized DUF497 family protein
MNGTRFGWDEKKKERRPPRKHGVSFEEARTAFLDENARSHQDHLSSESRPR